MIARFAGSCGRCFEAIRPGDRIVRHRHGMIHASCASGQDDE